jgi:hypothetical protein
MNNQDSTPARTDKKGISSFALSKLIPWLPLSQDETDVLRIYADHWPKAHPSVKRISFLAKLGTTRAKMAIRSLERRQYLQMTEGQNKSGGNPRCGTKYSLNIGLFVDAATERQIEWENKYAWRPESCRPKKVHTTPETTHTTTPTDGCRGSQTTPMTTPTDGCRGSQTTPMTTPTDGCPVTEGVKENVLESVKERVKPPALPPKPSGNDNLAGDYFVWLAITHDGLSLSRKEKAEITQIVSSGIYDLDILKEASQGVLNFLDVTNTFDRAGEKLACGLAAKAEACQRERQSKKAIEREIERITREAEAQAKRDLQAARAAREADELLAGEGLPQEA